MSDDGFKPFADDQSVLSIGGISIENGYGEILVHGSLEISHDPDSVNRVRRLAAKLNAIADAAESRPATAPEQAKATGLMLVKNPFRKGTRT